MQVAALQSQLLAVPGQPNSACKRTPVHCLGATICLQQLAVEKRSRLKTQASKQADDPHVGSLQDIANELLAKDPETAARLKRLEEAARNVATLQAMQADVEAAMREAAAASPQTQQAQEKLQAQRATERMTDAEVEAAAKLVEAAELELAAAQAAKMKWNQEIDEDGERQQSLKAGLVAAAGALVSTAPFLLSGGQPPLGTFLAAASVALSGLLFGTTYRYALRADVYNTQLKGGVVAAFGLVRALGGADIIQRDAGGTLQGIFTADVVGRGLLYAGQSMLMFGFAALALEVMLQQGALKPFGTTVGDDKQQND